MFNPCFLIPQPEDLLERLEGNELWDLEMDDRLRILQILCHRIMSSYSVQDYLNETQASVGMLWCVLQASTIQGLGGRCTLLLWFYKQSVVVPHFGGHLKIIDFLAVPKLYCQGLDVGVTLTSKLRPIRSPLVS